MSQDNEDPAAAGKPGFIGEEDTGERVSARQNLIAALVLASIAVLAMVLAVRLETPGRFYSAPGLLPFLVGLSLLAMAVALGAMAVRNGGARSLFANRGGFRRLLEDEEQRRTLLLLAIITVYVVLVDLVPFEWRMPAGGFDLRFTGYELFSIAALTLILRIFWRRPVSHCLAVSFVMVIALAAIFRHGFRILLPGLG